MDDFMSGNLLKNFCKKVSCIFFFRVSAETQINMNPHLLQGSR